MFTDHKPLTMAIHKSTSPLTARQQRHLAFVSEFTTNIRHVNGKDNLVADFLSRAFINDVSLGIDFIQMAKAQVESSDIQAYRTAITNLKLADLPIYENGPVLLCDTSTGRPRPVVPLEFRRAIFDLVHGLSHPSKRTTQKLVSAKYVWHGLKKDITKWASECLDCQASKVHKHVRAPLETFTVPARRFSHIHVDLVGPLPPSQGYTHLFTIIDRTTRWPEAIPLFHTTTADCAQALISSWIARFGIPADITSDRGPQFTSALWTELANRLQIGVHRTTAYHPQSNGLVERFHRTMKTALKARLHNDNWVNELPWVLLGIRTAPKEDIGVSSAELVYGETLTVPGEFLGIVSEPWSPHTHLSPLHEQIKKFAPVPTSRHSEPRSRIPQELFSARFVFVRQDAHRGPLQRPYHGPYQVIATGEKSFLIQMGNRRSHVSIDRLQPAHLELDSHSGTTNEQSFRNFQGESEPLGVQRTRSGRLSRAPDRYNVSAWGGSV